MGEGKWPNPCACGHSAYAHHLRHTGEGFGPAGFCTGKELLACPCEEYRPVFSSTVAQFSAPEKDGT